jgi:ABC-2 type transport system ATP-binding protein
MVTGMIEVDTLTKSFGPTTALAGVSFRVGAGEIVGLLGPNGAGKTTLVRAVATLLRPDSGTVRVDGIDVTRDAQRVRERIGLAGQAAAVDGLLTGRENLELIGGLYGLDAVGRRARATEVLERFDLVDAADRRAGAYSGGMRRRLDLGATLVGRPAVMLLDEPTAGLDPRSRNELWSLVDEIAADGTTVLLTSQYLEEVERLADRVVVIDRGAVVADGSPDALKRAVGADVLEARVVDLARLEAAGALLEDLGDGASLDRDERRVAVSTRAGIPALITAARRLDDAGIGLVDLGLRRPSLDDVFFAITGDRAEPLALDLPAAVETPADVARATERPLLQRRPLANMALLTRRALVRYIRAPQVLYLGTTQPIVFLVMLNAVFGGLVTGAQGGSYVQYLLPGVIVMNVLLGASVTAAGMAEDLRDGIVDRFRSLPMSRVAVLVGRTLADLGRNAIALALLVVVGVFMGFRFDGGAPAAIGCLALVLLFVFAVSWLFTFLGMAVKEPQAAPLLSLLVALPLVYLSGVWIPVGSMSPRLQWFARNQPVNVLVEALRALSAGEPALHRVWVSMAWCAGILLVAVPLCVRRYRGDGY